MSPPLMVTSRKTQTSQAVWGLVLLPLLPPPPVLETSATAWDCTVWVRLAAPSSAKASVEVLLTLVPTKSTVEAVTLPQVLLLEVQVQAGLPVKVDP